MSKCKPVVRFWMVWSPQGRAPTQKHRTKINAEHEAVRLAERNPGAEFFVLKATGGCQAKPPKITDIKMVSDPDAGIPF